MIHSETSQQNAFQNPQQTSPHVAAALQQLAQALQQNQQTQQGGLGQGLFGQGAFGQGVFGQNTPFGARPELGRPTPVSQQEVSNALQQIAPILPQIIAQAQQKLTCSSLWRRSAAAMGLISGPCRSRTSTKSCGKSCRSFPSCYSSNRATARAVSDSRDLAGRGKAPMGSRYSGYSGSTNIQRQLSPQDVNEIARQLAEVIPSPTASACDEPSARRAGFPARLPDFIASSAIRSAKWLILNGARQLHKIRA